MAFRFKLNLAAAAVIAAGALMLSGTRPAHAAAFDGCAKMRKAIFEGSLSCADVGGTYTYSGSCSGETYSLEASCF